MWSRLLNSKHEDLLQSQKQTQQRLDELELELNDVRFELALSESECIRLRSQVVEAEQFGQLTTQSNTVYQGLLLPIASTLQADHLNGSPSSKLVDIGEARLKDTVLLTYGASATVSSFSIGQTPITQALFIAVMGHNPSEFVDLMRGGNYLMV